MQSYRGVLVTGASGGIGRTLRTGLRGRFPKIRWSDIVPIDDVGPEDEAEVADLADLDAVTHLMRGMDAVVHLGGISVEDEWDALLPANIVGVYNLYEAARRAGVQRVVFASSNHVTGFYRRTQTIGPDVAPRPDSRYGVTKVFGEAIARMYADKHGIQTVSLRIGQFRPAPSNERMLSLWISHEDMVRLVIRSLEADDVHFEVVYGISGNARAWYDNPGGQRIGYAPEQNAEDHRDAAMAAAKEPGVGRLFQGGPFCTDEFDANPDAIS